MKIRLYQKSDAEKLHLLLSKDLEWASYFSPSKWQKYLKVLKDSRALVMFDGEEMIAFLRYKLDGAFGVYIYDLLVDNERRGHNYGKALISRLQAKYPNDYIYVMSDNDGYYRHLGFEIEGTIFKIQNGR